MRLLRRKPAVVPKLRIVDSNGKYVPPSLVARVWVKPVEATTGVVGYEVMADIGGNTPDTVGLCYDTDPVSAQTMLLQVLDSL